MTQGGSSWGRWGRFLWTDLGIEIGREGGFYGRGQGGNSRAGKFRIKTDKLLIGQIWAREGGK